MLFVMREKSWGEVILKARQAKGLSREELAARIGCSYFTVMRWEQEKSVPIRVFRRKLEEILGIDLSGLEDSDASG